LNLDKAFPVNVVEYQHMELCSLNFNFISRERPAIWWCRSQWVRLLRWWLGLREFFSQEVRSSQTTRHGVPEQVSDSVQLFVTLFYLSVTLFYLSVTLFSCLWLYSAVCDSVLSVCDSILSVCDSILSVRDSILFVCDSVQLSV